ncbi:MAG TPA: hypothetical protein VGW75_03720 [Solirubrobacteraceae bacterium]|nr:hypothetical protein [Solirubrobacteraceae bacterium]
MPASADRAAGSSPRLLGATALLIVVAELFANDAEPAGTLVLSAFGIAVAAVLLLAVLPRVDPRAHGILAASFALTALFTCVAYWSALPFAFGAAAVAASRRPTAPAALLGAFAVVLALVFCIIA